MSGACWPMQYAASELSMPPDRKLPISTSAISCAATDSSNTRLISSAHSSRPFDSSILYVIW